MKSRKTQGLAAGIETRSIDWVPEHARHGTVSDQGKFWFLGNFHFFTIAIGFIGPSMGLSLGWTALGGAIGIVIGTIFQAFHANQGAELGLPQMIQSRAQFGYRGVILPLFATLVTYLGFNVVDTILITNGVTALLGWNAALLAALVSIIGAALAIWGHDWLHAAFKLLFWVSLPLFTVLSFLALVSGAPALPGAALGFNWVAFCTELAAGASYNITYATYVSDYSRYLPPNTPRVRVITSVFLGAALSAIWLIALGAWLATRISAADPLVSLTQAGDRVAPGYGAAVALASVAALVATMGMNFYSGMLTVVTAIDSLRKLRPTRALRVVVIVGLTLASFVLAQTIGSDGVQAVNASFVVMLYLLAPWTAVNLTDYYFVRKGGYAVTHLFTPDGVYGRWRRQGLLAYLIGFAASLPFIVIPDFAMGPVARALGGIDVGWLVGLSSAAGAYLFLTRRHDPGAEREALAQSREALRGLSDAGR
jgi:nucleobase:cation symporter-1, NCS1 family